MKIVLLGMSHRTAPLELRERLAVGDPSNSLRKLVAYDEIGEAVVFSTCNRFEVVAATGSPAAASQRLRAFLSEDLGGSAGDLSEHVYEHTDGAAVRHVLRVASSLDSMVVGESQILGQTKDAWQRSVDCGASGPLLGRLFQHAFSTAKRVRTETKVGERPVSVARVAVDLAKQIFEDLSGKHALLVGAGEMVEASLEALRNAGLDAVRVANRTPERAVDLAARFSATAHGLDELSSLVERSDVVLTCIASHRPILTRALIGKSRRRGPLFVIDIGVPRNVDPSIEELDDVYLYDIDDLSSVAEENSEKRRRETADAEAIVAEECGRFDGWVAALRAVPTIRELRENAELLREAEVERALRRPEFAAASPEALEQLTRAIVNKILHAPVSRLRREAELEGDASCLEAARVLFALDDDASRAEEE